ncbi:MAG: electron transfer flavoprotein-ubiquinone oxidoreductase [Hyphomicrobiaceae bacterium]|nr:electron transfer flavoprotein-ubiquinone oxidoreductase [Hyphomicrobiaceae bacterium]
MECDVVIVGAGPAGLSASIRLMQIASRADKELSVVVLDKGSEIGAHILSGAVLDPIGLCELFPDWKQRGAPIKTEVKRDTFLYLGPAGDITLPNFLMPPLMNNHGNYIVSLGDVVRWLGEQAEALGVQIFPGFAASELLYDSFGTVVGVAIGDMGIGRDGSPKDTFERGIELRAKYVLLAEGARGSLSKEVIRKFALDHNAEPQKYGIGLKELWQVSPEKHKPGLVQHSFGWPLKNGTGGGSFLYHYGDDLVSVGFVVHLDYTDPYISPYDEFQRFKTHPAICETFEGGKRISYGARAISEGGWQSLPQLVFPGGALIGCSAGMLNLPRIKGSHNAILSGISAADAILTALGDARQHDKLISYEVDIRNGIVAADLKKVRNVKPLLTKFGTFAGICLGGADMWLNTIIPCVGLGFTLKHKASDHETLRRAAQSTIIDYPKADGILTFDILTNVSFSATNHEEDQPVHLHLKDDRIPIEENIPKYAEPAQRYCPAKVYEVIEDSSGKQKLQINAQNCVHCKTCDIKDPSQNINWTCPEGGGGPNYTGM